jgi:hypothetical protein
MQDTENTGKMRNATKFGLNISKEETIWEKNVKISLRNYSVKVETKQTCSG